MRRRALLLALLMAVALPAAAAKQGLPRPLYQQLDRAQRLLAADQPAAALSLLEQASKRARGDYANAVVLQSLGYAQLELQRLSAAAKSFEAALALDALPATTQHALRYNLAQILAGDGRSNEAIRLLERYLADAKSPPLRAKLLLAQLYALQDRWHKVPPLLTGLAAGLAKRSDQERVLRLLVSAYTVLEQPQRALRPLKTLLGWFPDRRDYWLRLADSYLMLEREADALSVLETAHLNGALRRGDDLHTLASLYLRQGIPYRAAELLQQALDDGRLPATAANLKLSAQAWEMARARQATVEALRRALERDQDWDHGLARRLVQLLQDGRQWQQAATVLRTMLKQADGEQHAELGVLLGINEYRAGRLEQARSAFNAAADPDAVAVTELGSDRRQARQWLDYLDYLDSAG